MIHSNDPICEMMARKVAEIGARDITNTIAITEIAHRELGQ